MNIWIVLTWIVSLIVAFGLGVLAAISDIPANKDCTCYYDASGKRAWPGVSCPVHKKSTEPSHK